LQQGRSPSKLNEARLILTDSTSEIIGGPVSDAALWSAVIYYRFGFAAERLCVYGLFPSVIVSFGLGLKHRAGAPSGGQNNGIVAEARLRLAASRACGI
jgi:hypothetical protein